MMRLNMNYCDDPASGNPQDVLSYLRLEVNHLSYADDMIVFDFFELSWNDSTFKYL